MKPILVLMAVALISAACVGTEVTPVPVAQPEPATEPEDPPVPETLDVEPIVVSMGSSASLMPLDGSDLPYITDLVVTVDVVAVHEVQFNTPTGEYTPGQPIGGLYTSRLIDVRVTELHGIRSSAPFEVVVGDIIPIRLSGGSKTISLTAEEAAAAGILETYGEEAPGLEEKERLATRPAEVSISISVQEPVPSVGDELGMVLQFDASGDREFRTSYPGLAVSVGQVALRLGHVIDLDALGAAVSQFSEPAVSLGDIDPARLTETDWAWPPEG